MTIKKYYYNKVWLEENKFELVLLKRYLSKHFGEVTAIELMKKNKDNLFGAGSLSYSLGERDIEYFILHYLRDTFVPSSENTARELGKVHFEIFEELQKMFIRDEYDKELFVLARGLGKSTVINKAISCYLHCYKKSKFTIVIGNKESDAIQFVFDTRTLLEGRLIVETFGELVKYDRTRIVNKQELELDNDTKIQAFSWGSSVRGVTYGSQAGICRPTLVICDDNQSEADILSQNSREKCLNKYYKEVQEVGDSAVFRDGVKIKQGTKFLVIGTPLASDDFINSIRKDNTFRVFLRGVVDFDFDSYIEGNEYWQHFQKILNSTSLTKEDKDLMLREYYRDNEEEMKFPTLWDKYRCDDLVKKYYTQRLSFMQELLCSTELIGKRWFGSVRKISRTELPESYKKTMLLVDTASTTNIKSDFSAFVVGSLHRNGFKYVRRGSLKKLSFNELCFYVIELLEEFKDVTHVYIEKNTYQGADLIKIKELISQNPLLRNRKLEFINEMQRKNKDDKISAIVDDVNSGQVIFCEEDTEFIKQVLDFTGAKYSLHDDAPDILSEFVKRIDEIKVSKKIVVRNKSDFGF